MDKQRALARFHEAYNGLHRLSIRLALVAYDVRDNYGIDLHIGSYSYNMRQDNDEEWEQVQQQIVDRGKAMGGLPILDTPPIDLQTPLALYELITQTLTLSPFARDSMITLHVITGTPCQHWYIVLWAYSDHYEIHSVEDWALAKETIRQRIGGV